MNYNNISNKGKEELNKIQIPKNYPLFLNQMNQMQSQYIKYESNTLNNYPNYKMNMNMNNNIYNIQTTNITNINYPNENFIINNEANYHKIPRDSNYIKDKIPKDNIKAKQKLIHKNSLKQGNYNKINKIDYVLNNNIDNKKPKGKQNQIKLKNIFKNLKSDYFLKTIFNNLNKKKILEVVKYNKIYKQRLNISINDYKEYSELYSSIELEITPYKERKYFYYITDREEKDKLYYHIYFDNISEEINRNVLFEHDKITKIKIKIDYPVKSFWSLFNFCQYIKSINFKKFY